MGGAYLEKTSVGKDPMKFQCEIEILGKPALLNVAVNANTFLSRDFATQHLDSSGTAKAGEPSEPSDTSVRDVVNITLEFESPLSEGNEVLNIPTSGPTIRIKRDTADVEVQKAMQQLAKLIRNELFDYSSAEGPRLALAAFGVVAHEVGTMRMQGPQGTKKEKYVVDNDLQIQGRSGLYVCDLSVFPVSPAANPSLTLVALAIRLTDHLE